MFVAATPWRGPTFTIVYTVGSMPWHDPHAMTHMLFITLMVCTTLMSWHDPGALFVQWNSNYLIIRL